MKFFLIKSFCKINLNLKIIDKLKNGMHSIHTIYTLCDIYDTIKINKIPCFKDNIVFKGAFSKNIKAKSNTIKKCLEIIREEGRLKNKFFKIEVNKKIPHGSGLGGGSSNAASVLKFLNYKFKLKFTVNKIQKVADKIGSDVALYLHNTKIKHSILPNKIFTYKSNIKLIFLIVYPHIHCSTKKVYSLNKKYSIFSKKAFLNLKFVNKESLIDYLKYENNDLEKTINNTYPKVKKLINFVKKQSKCCFARITGSGSACFGVFLNYNSAKKAKKMVKKKFPKYWSVISKSI